MKSITSASILALSTPLLAQAPASLERELDTQAPVLLAKHDVPSVAVAYIEDGEIAFVRHYGEQQWGFPANEETLYNLASLTKPVTAEVVLRLVAEGKLSLDSKLADHHVEEDVADDPRIMQLTPQLVMHHRTGLPNWRYQTDDVLTFIADPDTKEGYSGEGYDWMMKAAAKAAGEDFEIAARRLVFDPAEMPLTSYTETGKFAYRIASPYKAGEAVHNVVRDEPSAADDMRSTAREYARFMLSVFEGDAVPAALREEQFTIRHTSPDRRACAFEEKEDFCPAKSGWGLGWFIYDWGDRKVYQHGGGDHGEKTFAYYDPEARDGAVIFTNGAEGHHVMFAIVDLLDEDERFAKLLASQ